MLQVCLKTIKREFEDAQEQETHDRKPHMLEELQINKFKGCDSLQHSSGNGQVIQILYSGNSVY